MAGTICRLTFIASRVKSKTQDDAVIPQSKSTRISDDELRRAILAGYPDRVGWRREPSSSRVKLSSGAGAVIAPESGVRGGEFLVAIDVQASTRPNDPESRIRIASLIDREWLLPTSSERVHRLDGSGTVRATEIDRYDELILSEKPAAIDEDIAARLLADAWRSRDPSPEDARLMRRLKFAHVSFDIDEMIAAAARADPFARRCPARSRPSVRRHTSARSRRS